MNKLFITLLLVAGTIFASCSSTKEYNYGSEASLSNIKWVVEKINGLNVNYTDYTMSYPWITMMINATAFEGSTGCNSIKGSVNATPESISFSHITSTKMACPDSDEAVFLKALTDADSWKAKNDRLYLYSGSSITAVFKREEQQN